MAAVDEQVAVFELGIRAYGFQAFYNSSGIFAKIGDITYLCSSQHQARAVKPGCWLMCKIRPCVYCNLFFGIFVLQVYGFDTICFAQMGEAAAAPNVRDKTS